MLKKVQVVINFGNCKKRKYDIILDIEKDKRFFLNAKANTEIMHVALYTALQATDMMYKKIFNV